MIERTQMPGDCFAGVGGQGPESMSTVGRHCPVLVTCLRLVLPRLCFVGSDISIGDSLRLLLACLPFVCDLLATGVGVLGGAGGSCKQNIALFLGPPGVMLCIYQVPW